MHRQLLLNLNLLYLLLSSSWKEHDLFWYISVIRQTVRYRTQVFTQPFSWRLHITITSFYLKLRLYYIQKLYRDRCWCFLPFCTCTTSTRRKSQTIRHIRIHRADIMRDVKYDAIWLFRIMSIPNTLRLFRVMTSEMLGRLLPVFMLLLWQRQHISPTCLDIWIFLIYIKSVNQFYWWKKPEYLPDKTDM
jgi:hypothetical protein